MKMEQLVLPGNILRVKLTGPLDITGASKIDMPFCVSQTNIVVDLSGVSFLASIGIRVLIMTARTLGSKGGRLVVYSPSEEAIRKLRETGIDDIIPITATETAAIAAFAT
jgi:anti-anti-sigma factor